MYTEHIDWSVFDGDPKATCYCRCGAVFHSHAKGIYKPPYRSVTRECCPQCGQNDNCNRISFEPETFNLKG